MSHGISEIDCPNIKSACIFNSVSPIRMLNACCLCTPPWPAISDAANGGQILTDYPTFIRIKERLDELLGGHNGANEEGRCKT